MYELTATEIVNLLTQVGIGAIALWLLSRVIDANRATAKEQNSLQGQLITVIADSNEQTKLLRFAVERSADTNEKQTKSIEEVEIAVATAIDKAPDAIATAVIDKQQPIANELLTAARAHTDKLTQQALALAELTDKLGALPTADGLQKVIQGEFVSVMAKLQGIEEFVLDAKTKLLTVYESVMKPAPPSPPTMTTVTETSKTTEVVAPVPLTPVAPAPNGGL